MSKQSVPVILSPEDRQQLQEWETSHKTPQQVALHCRIILAAANGQPSLQIASALHINRHTAALWRQRARNDGIQSVWK